MTSSLRGCQKVDGTISILRRDLLATRAQFVRIVLFYSLGDWCFMLLALTLAWDYDTSIDRHCRSALNNLDLYQQGGIGKGTSTCIVLIVQLNRAVAGSEPIAGNCRFGDAVVAYHV